MSDGDSYPLDHRLGYAVVPRDARNLEPLIRDPAAFQVWTWLHLKARHKAGWVHASNGSEYLERGEVLVGLRQLGKALGRDKMTIARAINRLEKFGLIARKARQEARHRGSVISIRRYGDFLARIDEERDTAADIGADTPADTDADIDAYTGADLRNRREPSEPPKRGERKEPSRPAGAALDGQQERLFKDGSGTKGKKATKSGIGSEVESIKEAFDSRFIAANGGKPTWRKHDFVNVTGLVKEHGAAEVLRRIENAFTAPPDWLGTPDLGGLVKHFDKYVQPAKRAAGHFKVTGAEVYGDGPVEDF